MSERSAALRGANMLRPIVLLGALIALLLLAATAEARDLTGAWVSDAAACNKIFTGSGSKLSFAEDADVYGSGFIYQGNTLKGKNATCVIKTQKEDADVLHLITTCATDVALETVQFSLKINNDDQITRFFPGVPELKTDTTAALRRANKLHSVQECRPNSVRDAAGAIWMGDKIVLALPKQCTVSRAIVWC